MKHEQPVIETKHLYVAYQDKLVLEDVTFAVNRSEFLGILGPNGSGKSTLLKAILGLIQPLSGEAFVFGKTSTRLNKERRRIGYVPQSVDINLQFPIDVWDTVMLGRSRLIGPGKRPGDPDKRAVRQALEQVELDELANQPIGHLSGGQRQRALIARALAVEPDLLILDEPTAALDINSTESFYEWLYKMQKQMKLTLLIVSHDVGVVSQYVDAVACLNRKLVTHGIPNQVLGKDTLEEMYGCEAMFFGHGDVPHLVVPRKNGSDLQMIDLLTYTFMQRALVMATVTGTLCALIGVYVVLRHMSFIGAGIAHASFGGVAIGLLIGIQPFFTSVVFCSLTAYAIGYVSEHHRIREDTAVGIFFASTMALGVLLIGFIEGYNPDLFGYIFGNVLAVTRFDVIAGVVLLLLVGGILFYYFKEFMFLSFDPAMARVIGLPVRRLNYMMLTLIALTIVISIKAVGIVLVSALIVTPAAAAHQWTQDFRRMMFLAVLFGVGSSWIGLFFSAALNLPSGATIVLTATFVFLISSVFSPQTRKLKRHRRALQQKLQQETG